jgi:replicative DNA helicase
VAHLPKAQIRLFLRHLWATDGSVTVSRNGRSGRVYYGSTSRQLCDDVSRLLLRFGISTRLRAVTAGEHRQQWTLDISGVDDQRRFLDESACTASGARRSSSCARRSPTSRRTRTSTPSPAEVWQRSVPSGGTRE